MKIDKYNCNCVKIALKRARDKDSQGRKKKWYMEGTSERAEATEIFRQACVMAELIYSEKNMYTGRVYKEFAEHLQSRHEEKGRLEYSMWNRSTNIPEDELSGDAKVYYNKAIVAFTNNVSFSGSD